MMLLVTFQLFFFLPTVYKYLSNIYIFCIHLYCYHDTDSNPTAQASLEVTLDGFAGVIAHAAELPHCTHRSYKITDMYGNTDGPNIVYLSLLSSPVGLVIEA